MKVFIILFLTFMASCQPSSNLSSGQTTLLQDKNYHRVPNSAKTYILHYKIEESMRSPVKNFTYFVSKYDGSAIVRQPETTAAEKIYWKDNSTVALVPFTDAARQPGKVGAPEEKNEILIIIKS